MRSLKPQGVAQEARRSRSVLKARRKLLDGKVKPEMVQLLRAQNGLGPIEFRSQSGGKRLGADESDLIKIAIDQSARNADLIRDLRQICERDFELTSRIESSVSTNFHAVHGSAEHDRNLMKYPISILNIGVAVALGSLAYLAVAALNGFLASVTRFDIAGATEQSELYLLGPQIGLCLAVALTVAGFIWIQKD